MLTVTFGLYLILLILRPQEFIPALENVPILQCLMYLCLILWVASQNKRLGLPQFGLVLLFLLTTLLGKGLSGWWGGLPTVLATLLPVIAIFLIATVAARSVGTLRRYMAIVVICSCLLVLHAQVQMDNGIVALTGIRSFQGRPYYSGIFSDPNDLGQLFVVALAFGFYLNAIATSGLRRWLLWAAILWLAYGIFLTNSRGALLAALAIIAVEGIRRYGAIALGISASLALPTLFAATRLSQLNSSEQSAADRIDAWRNGVQMLRDYPLFGVGFGNFEDHNPITAHNFIVLAMAELGLVGFSIWLAILWYSTRMLYWVGYGPHAAALVQRGVASTAASIEVNAGRALMAAWMGFCISSFFLSQSYKAPLFLLSGMAIARFTAASAQLPNPPQYSVFADAPKIVALTLAVVLGMYLFARFAN